MSAVSIEAQVHAAARYLSLRGDERRARWLGVDPGPLPVFPDHRGFARDAASALALDPAAAALLGEASLSAALRAPHRRYDDLRGARPLRLREEAGPIALQGVRSVVSVERNAPRRDALLAALSARLGELDPSGRDVVDALRGAFDALPEAVRDALLPAVDDAEALFAATDELWRELDRRVLRALELDPARVSWGDRLRSFAGPSLVREVPPATWAALSVAWWARIGDGDALRGVVDRVGASSPQATGVYALVDASRGRAELLGRPAPSAWDAAELLGLGSLCVGAAGAKGLWSAHRRGVDRFADGVLHALGRRLLHERSFLQRAAQLDARARERVRVEALHAEVARLRWDAALGRFLRDALGRAPSLGARFSEAVTRAWGASPPPAWALHLVADAAEQGGPWGGSWGVRDRGARGEAALRARLRDRFDEDWHRNPRAGEWLGATLDALRAQGEAGWEDDAEMSAEAQARRLAGDYLAGA